MTNRPNQPFEAGATTLVQEVMTPSVITVLDSDSVGNAIIKLREENISALPVVNAKGALVGMISENDLARIVLEIKSALDSNYPHYDDCLWAVELIQRRLGSECVRSIMSEVVITVHSDCEMHNAACIMASNRVHHLPVTNASGQIIGMLSSSDFVRLTAGIDPSMA